MSRILWKSPVPSTAYLRDVEVKLNPKREVILTFAYEDLDKDEECEIRTVDLIFYGVVQYQTTYLAALSVDMISEAYDKVVDMGESADLTEVKLTIKARRWPAEIAHYRVCFDDGPCFDFLASAFEARVS